MNKLIATVAVLFAFGGTAAAAAAVNWPATCSSNYCVNNHLNDLNARLKALDKATFSKTVVVSRTYVFSDPANLDNISTVVACGTPDPSDNRPFVGWAISGGINISGNNADQWHIVSSGPPNMMNSWPVYAHNPDYVNGDPLPTVTVFAICLK